MLKACLSDRVLVAWATFQIMQVKVSVPLVLIEFRSANKRLLNNQQDLHSNYYDTASGHVLKRKNRSFQLTLHLFFSCTVHRANQNLTSRI